VNDEDHARYPGRRERQLGDWLQPMLSGVENTTYSSFFFVSFKNWEEPKTPEESYIGIKKHLTSALSKVTQR